MKNRTKTCFAMLAAASAIGLTACGGGSSSGQTVGAGGGAGGGSGAVTYTGLQTEATVSNTNKTDLTASAYQGGTTGGSIGSAASQTSGTGQTGQPRHLALSATLKDAVRKIDFRSAAKNASSKLIYSDTSTIDGDCPGAPGSATITMSISNITGNFSGNVSFNAYCTQGNTINGNTGISGRLDLSTGDWPAFDMTFESLTSSSSCGDSIMTTGGINSSVIGATTTEVMNMLVKDNGTSEVFWLEEFSTVTTDYGSYMDIVMNGGRFYHPDFGYVSAVTEPGSPLRIYTGNDWPSSGTVVYTGKTGALGMPTRAKLIVVSSSQYRIEADIYGSGVFAYNSGNLTWDTGFCSY